ncbi:MAG: hypothetical protein KF855_03420 [Acidobacteria bacterium]|nr:hypothetical protein [Acidobacteriota bacterium]
MKIATPNDVKNVLALDDEQITELRKEQEKALKKFRSRARLNPLERRVGRGVELERHFRATGNMNGLAEALAMQGRFNEAAEYATRDDLKASFKEKAEACGCSECDCPSHRDENGLELPNQYVESYEVKDGKLEPSVRCVVCNKLSIGPHLEHLEKQRGVRAKAVEAGRESVTAQEFFRQQ